MRYVLTLLVVAMVANYAAHILDARLRSIEARQIIQKLRADKIEAEIAGLREGEKSTFYRLGVLEETCQRH